MSQLYFQNLLNWSLKGPNEFQIRRMKQSSKLKKTLVMKVTRQVKECNRQTADFRLPAQSSLIRQHFEFFLTHPIPSTAVAVSENRSFIEARESFLSYYCRDERKPGLPADVISVVISFGTLSIPAPSRFPLARSTRWKKTS